MRRIVSMGGCLAAALLLSLLPVRLRAGDRTEPLFVLNRACGQATECEAAPRYICSKADEDIRDARCSKGCETAPPLR